MPKFPAGSLSRLALRSQVNRALAERGADVRIVEARNATERTMLGDSYLVDCLKRHVIVRDHVDLHDFARAIGLASSWPGAAPQTGSVLSMAPEADAAVVGLRRDLSGCTQIKREGGGS